MEIFKTFDASLAAFLCYHNFPVEFQTLNGRVFFVFHKTDELDTFVSSYHNGASVDLAQYLDVSKTLKMKMFKTRGAR